MNIRSTADDARIIKVNIGGRIFVALLWLQWWSSGTRH
jgi:hypothetical protein